ncbi:hypothetical protein ACVWZB_004777 [Paenibacillus polymyxa]
MILRRTIKVGNIHVEQGGRTISFVVEVSIGGNLISTSKETHAKVYDILDTADRVAEREGWAAVAHHGQLMVSIKEIVTA